MSHWTSFLARIEKYNLMLNPKKMHFWGNFKETAWTHSQPEGNRSRSRQDQSHSRDAYTKNRERGKGIYREITIYQQVHSQNLLLFVILFLSS